MRTTSTMAAATAAFAITHALTIAQPAAAAEPDIAAGKSTFQMQCSACHSDKPGANGVGPSLAGLGGRKAGSLPGFSFTGALTHSGLTWDTATFNQFLTDPAKMVPGTSMAQTLNTPEERANVFAYLSSIKVEAAAAPAAPKPAVPTIKGPSQKLLDNAEQSTANWLYSSHDYSGTRYVALKQIRPSNAKSLRPVCLYRSTAAAPTQTSPLVYDGVMYLTSGPQTIAIDATNCREKWTYTWQAKGKVISPTNRGAAIKDGKLVRGTADGYLIALDMATGNLLWEKQIASANSNQYVSAPPAIFEDKVIIGPAGADFGPKNWIGAFSLQTGEQVWRFNLIPDENEPGAETWKNKEALKRGGGSIWTPVSIDAKAGVLYVPVGNPAPDFYGDVREGDNLYANSIVALDIKTGKLLWHRQMVRHDVHDSDLSQVSPLFSTKIGGKMVDVVTVSGKDGLLRLVDRKTHNDYYSVPITTRENVDAAPTVEGVHRCPGLLGGMEWNGPAYDPARSRLFVPAVDWCGTFTKFPQPPKYEVMTHYYGGGVASDPRDKSKGWLTALDARTGKVAWKYASPTPLVAGVTATAGGVLFTGDLNNNFLALDSSNGKVLYSFNTGGSIGGGVVSYDRGGKQYVATVSGNVSAFFGGSGMPAVVIFALP